MKFGSLFELPAPFFLISARHAAEALFRALDEELHVEPFLVGICVRTGFEPAVFRDEHHPSESKVTIWGAYKAAVCKGRNEVARCSGNIEGVYRQAKSAPVGIVCADFKDENSSKKTATTNLREFIDLHETATIRIAPNKCRLSLPALSVTGRWAI
jgi:hypothetical protein